MRAVVIGIGNTARGDDGVGPAVLRHLGDGLDPGVVLLELDGEPARLTEAWSGADLAVVVDAACAGGVPGTVVRLDIDGEAPSAPAPATSSHGLGVAEAIELAGALGRLPVRLVVFGVEPACVEAGFELSPAVRAAVPEVADLVRSELRSEPCASR